MNQLVPSGGREPHRHHFLYYFFQQDQRRFPGPGSLKEQIRAQIRNLSGKLQAQQGRNHP